MKNIKDFTVKRFLGILDGFGFTFIGVAFSLFTATPINIVLGAKFFIVGFLTILASFLLSLMVEGEEIRAEKPKKRKRKKKRKKRKKK
jgi:hypothetical protein